MIDKTKLSSKPNHLPALRQSLSLDDQVAQQAYQRNYGQFLPKIYASNLPFVEQLRKLWASFAQWLEELPPTWAAFSLTLTETVGAGILALPIAMAGIGPLPGVVLLVVFGIFNILTIAAVAETITRNGSMRYGYTFFGRLVGDYLGRFGTLILTLALFLLIFLVLIAYYVGVTTTLADATGVPETVWAALLFLGGFYFLRRESLGATIASALFVGMINIGLVIILSILAWPHIRSENLFYMNVPFLNGQPFSPITLELVFGVVIAAYYGHTSAGNMAKTVLNRDPTGKSLLWGNVAAMAATMGLYSLWVVTVNGVIDPVTLANTSGTALIPLAAVVGPSVHIFGSIFVVLSLGMASIHFSLALFNQVREWLPAQSQVSSSASTATGFVSRIRTIALSKAGRFWIGFLPVALIFLLVEWLLLTDQESFAGPYAFFGVVSVPVLSGILPVLILVASRRKGDYSPGVVWRFLGHPVVVIGLYLIFLASILVHGLFIWSDPAPRLAAFVASGMIIIVTFIVTRQGAFAPRAVVELRASRQTTQKPAVFTVTSIGQPLPADIYLKYKNDEQHLHAASGDIPNFSNLRVITLHLPPTPAKELKLWLHQITWEDCSERLSGRVTIQQGQKKRKVEITSSDGQLILPLDHETCWVEITLVEEAFKDLLADL